MNICARQYYSLKIQQRLPPYTSRDRISSSPRPAGGSQSGIAHDPPRSDRWRMYSRLGAGSISLNFDWLIFFHIYYILNDFLFQYFFSSGFLPLGARRATLFLSSSSSSSSLSLSPSALTTLSRRPLDQESTRAPPSTPPLLAHPMVSALWTASSEGNIDSVLEQLNGPSAGDIEIKGAIPIAFFYPYPIMHWSSYPAVGDVHTNSRLSPDQTGSTPLIEAVKNGHVGVVQVLLDHGTHPPLLCSLSHVVLIPLCPPGADPSNPSTQGPPESYTSDPAILSALQAAKMKRAPLPTHAEEPGYLVEPNGEHPHQPQQHFYPPPPPGPYMYYPPPPPEGAVPFYPPPPPPASEHHPGAPTSGHLPPPDVARFIPCRYFPACRYGASCMFAHPPGPFYSGSMPPPAQYPGPYDPMGAQQGYPPNYYPMPPPPFPPQANGVPPPMSPQSATSPYGHTPQGSELVSPSLNQFSSNHAAAPAHYPVLSPMAPNFSPAQLPPPGQMMAPSPLGEQAPNGGGYPDVHPVVASSPDAQQEALAQDPANSVPIVLPDQSHAPPPPLPQPAAAPAPSQAEAYPLPPSVPHAGHRNPAGHNRRGSIRKGSFSRKPPCLFFPSGKCWNG
jgi:hypothetical protein